MFLVELLLGRMIGWNNMKKLLYNLMMALAGTLIVVLLLVFFVCCLLYCPVLFWTLAVLGMSAICGTMLAILFKWIKIDE